MNKRERMINCLGGKDIDRAPGSFWRHFPEDRWFGGGAAEAHLDFYRSADLDFMKIMEEVRYFFDMKSAGDWLRYRPPGRNSPERLEQRELIKRISDAIGDECFIFTTVFDPLRTVGITMGYDYIETHIKDNPAAVSAAFSAMAESAAEYAADCLKSGADGIFFSSKGAEKGRFDPEVFEKIVLEPDGSICRAVYENSPNTILHICGFDTELAYYKDFPAAVVNWDCHRGSYGLNEGARLFPGKVILGGMDNRSGALIDGTDDEIRDAVKSVIAGFEQKNRFILGADCTLPGDADYHRVKIAVESLAEM